MRQKIFCLLITFYSLLLIYKHSLAQIPFSDQIIIEQAETKGAICVFAADLDGDGDMDILTASWKDPEIAWHENINGKGEFSKQKKIANRDRGATSINAAYIDNDNLLDLLTVWEDGKVIWYRNKGNGLFSGGSEIVNALGLKAAYAAKIDDDDDYDILVAGSIGIGWYENVDGSGLFEVAQIITTEMSNECHVADLDNDNDVDVITFHWPSRQIGWYEYLERNGEFKKEKNLLTICDAVIDDVSITAADLRYDGKMDLIIGYEETSYIDWLQSSGPGLFNVSDWITREAYGVSSIYAADLDNNGAMEVLSASSGTDKIECYRRIGAQFRMQEITNAVDGVCSIYAADLNSNGYLDVLSASTNDNKIAWYRNLTKYEPPKAPVLNSPKNDGDIRDNRPELHWTIPIDTDGDYLHFKIEIATDNSFSSNSIGSILESRNNTNGFYKTPPLLQNSGDCTYTLQNQLADGTYYWQVSAWDGVEYGKPSAPSSFTIDTAPPAAPSKLLANGKNPSDWTKHNSFIITWDNPQNDLSGIARCKYKFDTPPNEADQNSAEVINYSKAISVNKYHGQMLYLWCEDNAGNSGYQNYASVNLRYDNTPPPPPIDLQANDPDPNYDDLNKPFTITWKNPYDPSGIAHCKYRLGTQPTITDNPTPPLTIEAERPYGQMLYLWLEDGAGNSNYQNCDSVNLYYEITTPVILSPKPGQTLPGYVPIFTNTFKFKMDSCFLQYKQNSPNYQGIDLAGESMRGKNQFFFVWEPEEPLTEGNVFLKLSIWDSAKVEYPDSVQFYLDPNSGKPFAFIHAPRDDRPLNGVVNIIGYAIGERYNLTLNNGFEVQPAISISEPLKKHKLCEWNTKKNTKDGKYTLFLNVWNTEGETTTDSISIIIDNTEPDIKFITLLPDTISCWTEIHGEASDSNFKQITLKKCKVGERDTSIIAYSSNSSLSFNWNTMALNEDYTILLIAEDRGGLIDIKRDTVYINNPRFEAENGYKKKQGEFSLYIPPNGFSEPCAICLEKREIAEVEYDSTNGITPIVFVEISPELSSGKFVNKLSALSINYTMLLNSRNLSEDKLAVYYLDNENNNQLKFIGGTITKDNTITATIDTIGIYGLCGSDSIQSIEKKELELTLLPRVFSPLGNSYDTQTAISFELVKPTEVSIIIYNGAGRLVKNLVENERMLPGNKVEYWYGKDQWGNICVSDLYIVTVQAGGKMATRTVAVVNK